MTPVVDLGAVSALWLGILTSLSPCPLATNIAAVSYIGRQYRSPAKVTFSGLAYVLGRMGAYLALGALLVAGLLSAPGLSMFLQKSMNKVLGPVLILAGMVLLDLLRFPTLGGGVGEKMRENGLETGRRVIRGRPDRMRSGGWGWAAATRGCRTRRPWRRLP
jgi:cytochrome c-type biogenesis protein